MSATFSSFSRTSNAIRQRWLGNGGSCEKTMAGRLVGLKNTYRKPFAAREYLVYFRRYLQKRGEAQIDFLQKFRGAVKFVQSLLELAKCVVLGTFSAFSALSETFDSMKISQSIAEFSVCTCRAPLFLTAQNCVLRAISVSKDWS